MTSARVEKLLDEIRLLSEERYAIVQNVRKLVLSINPDSSEEVKYGGVLFSAGTPICGVFAYANHVSLEFSYGATLRDPHQVLEGKGKLRRHIKLQTVSDIADKHLAEYVKQAFANPEG